MKKPLCLLIVSLFWGTSTALYENCDFYQELQPKTNYYISSPGYPRNYNPASSCRWNAVSPPGTQVYLVCQTFNVPSSQNCYYDRLSISPTGNLNLADGINYCGNGSFHFTSTKNMMNIALITYPNSPGGSFLCNIGIQENTEPQPPSDCDCGWTNQMRIVGGVEAGVNEFPMMAALIDLTKREVICGGTIISNKYVVTAAHCFLGEKVENLALLVGDHNINEKNDTNSAQLYLIDEVIVHPEYSTSVHANDVALVRTSKDIAFSRQVGPACLPFLNSDDTFAGEQVTALGWGTVDFGGKTSDTLLKVNLDVLTVPQCRSKYGSRVTEKQICTYRKNKDACQSDSGGPLLWKDYYSGRMKLLGIISYGVQCASTYPGVNTRLTSYTKWIQDTTGEVYCVK